MTRRVVGVDIGGTKVLGVSVDPSNPDAVVETVRVSTPAGTEAILDTVVGVVADLAPGGAESLGVGIAGLVDDGGIVHISPNLPGVVDLDLRGRLADRLGIPVVVDNDATAAAFAEAQTFSTGDGIVIFVALGTGIGGGLVIDGCVQRGASGFAGEFGHMIVDPGGVRCVCGRDGCWERYASGVALERLAREHVERGAWVGAPAGGWTGEQVIESARSGDPQAAAVLDEFSGWVGLGLANLVSAFDPQRVILGGGVLDAADVLLDRIRLATRGWLFGADQRPEVEVVAARLGSVAGAVGAASLATGLLE